MHSTGAMVATSHPLATKAALDVLDAGGNAMDAAICACAVQCVVEPHSTGIGGDCFMLYAPGGGAEVIGYNGSGRAAQGYDVDWFRHQGIETIERLTPHSVTIPGTVDALVRLNADHGRLPLGDVLAAAIGFARDGYPVHSRVRFDWGNQEEFLKSNAQAAALFMPGGAFPNVGTIHRQPALAATLERVAERGRAGFYEGPVAEDIIATLQGLGGRQTMDDMVSHAGEYVTPIKTTYRGYDVHEVPPNGQGITALIMLNILSGFDLAGMEPLGVERVHTLLEAGRLAYNDRDALVADMAMADVPVERLLSAGHADELRGLIDPARAMTRLPEVSASEHKDTVYLSVVDRDRNAVSFINSLYWPFGSCILAAESGVMLQNRGECFVIDETHPNRIQPGKRPMHTIIPGMLTRGDRAVSPFGVMGGHYQSFGHAYVLSNIIDSDMNVQEALDAARFFPMPGGTVDVEDGLGEETRAGLARLGHTLSRPPGPLGSGQIIWIDHAEGVLTGGSDQRRDGCAMGSV